MVTARPPSPRLNTGAHLRWQGCKASHFSGQMATPLPVLATGTQEKNKQVLVCSKSDAAKLVCSKSDAAKNGGSIQSREMQMQRPSARKGWPWPHPAVRNSHAGVYLTVMASVIQWHLCASLTSFCFCATSCGDDALEAATLLVG